MAFCITYSKGTVKFKKKSSKSDDLLKYTGSLIPESIHLLFYFNENKCKQCGTETVVFNINFANRATLSTLNSSSPD